MADPRPMPSLRGRRILVAEDDYITAHGLKAELEDAGAEVLGPAADLDGALSLLAAGPAPDAAILDIDLDGTMVFPLAEALRRGGIPFVFATGYDDWAIPARYAGLPRLEKPLDVRQLVRALAG